MKFNEEKLKDFINNRPDSYWDKRSISLESLYGRIMDLDSFTIDELNDLLETAYNIYDSDEGDVRFNVKILMNNYYEVFYILEMEAY